MRYHRFLLFVLMLSGLYMPAQLLSTRINLTVTDKSLPEVLNEIEKNYDVRFAFDNFSLRNIKVTCAFEDTELEKVLISILASHELLFEETGETIILFPAPVAEDPGETMLPLIQSKWVPFARSEEDLFCYQLSGIGAGRIYALKDEMRGRDDTFVFIANSLEEFLNSLYTE